MRFSNAAAEIARFAGDCLDRDTSEEWLLGAPGSRLAPREGEGSRLRANRRSRRTMLNSRSLRLKAWMHSQMERASARRK